MTPQFNSRKKTNGYGNLAKNKVEEILILKKKEGDKTLLIIYKCLSSEQSWKGNVGKVLDI